MEKHFGEFFYRSIANRNSTLGSSINVNIVVPNGHVTESSPSCFSQCREQNLSPVLCQLIQFQKNNIYYYPNHRRRRNCDIHLADEAIAFVADETEDIINRQDGLLRRTYLKNNMDYLNSKLKQKNKK